MEADIGNERERVMVTCLSFKRQKFLEFKEVVKAGEKLFAKDELQNRPRFE